MNVQIFNELRLNLAKQPLFPRVMRDESFLANLKRSSLQKASSTTKIRIDFPVGHPRNSKYEGIEIIQEKAGFC